VPDFEAQQSSGSRPGGTVDTSPTFQRWVREFRRAQVPEGTAELYRSPAFVPKATALLIVCSGLTNLGRPSGTNVTRTTRPNVEDVGLLSGIPPG
jgi:hypothetical protein